MLYRNHNLIINKDFLEEYKLRAHAPVEKNFCDTAIHRVDGVDATEEDGLENFTDEDIEYAVISCMREDMNAVSRKETR